MNDVELVRQLIPLWYAERQWAVELLCVVFGFDCAQRILEPEHRGRHSIPGSNWIYRTHGVGVDIDRGGCTGGIDFDFDKPHPDPFRLRTFAIKQLNAGNIPSNDYRRLVDDTDRFETAARVAIAPQV